MNQAWSKVNNSGKGKPVGMAIAICQKSTGLSYKTGKPLKKRKPV